MHLTAHQVECATGLLLAIEQHCQKTQSEAALSFGEKLLELLENDDAQGCSLLIATLLIELKNGGADPTALGKLCALWKEAFGTPPSQLQ